jgi:hypothetical protein
MRPIRTVMAVLLFEGCTAVLSQFLLLPAVTAHAQSSGPSCPVELLDARWRPQAHANRLSLGQEAVLDLKYANRSADGIQEIKVVFKSTFVTSGTMGPTTTQAERTLVFESNVSPGKSGHTQLNIGPSSPGRGTVRLDSLVFKTGLKWKSEEGKACSAQVH